MTKGNQPEMTEKSFIIQMIMIIIIWDVFLQIVMNHYDVNVGMIIHIVS